MPAAGDEDGVENDDDVDDGVDDNSMGGEGVNEADTTHELL